MSLTAITNEPFGKAHPNFMSTQDRKLHFFVHFVCVCVCVLWFSLTYSTVILSCFSFNPQILPKFVLFTLILKIWIYNYYSSSIATKVRQWPAKYIFFTKKVSYFLWMHCFCRAKISGSGWQWKSCTFKFKMAKSALTLKIRWMSGLAVQC